MSISRTKATGEIQLDRGLTDVIKFACCILIALHHYSQYATSHDVGSNWLFLLLSAYGGYLGVAIFFFLSGYGLMRSEQKHHLSLSTFAKKRFLKIYLPVLLVTLLWLPIYMKVGLWDGSFGYLIFSILGGGNLCFLDNVLWFVRVLLLLYAMFFMYSTVRIRKNKTMSVLFIIVMTAFLTAFVGMVYAPSHAMSIPCFAIGVIAADNSKVVAKQIRKSYTLIPLALAAALLFFLFRDKALTLYVLMNYLIILAILLAASSFYVKISGLPAWIGPYSYDIYLTHKKVLMAVTTFIPSLSVWLFTLTTAIVATGFYWIRKLFKL